MIRSEAMQVLARWREALAGLGISALGLWSSLATFGVLRWLGWVLLALGIALLLAGIQRGRLRRQGEGPGVVTVDERRVVYFGPETGGAADMDFLARLDLAPGGRVWRLVGTDGGVLDIPVDAKGADALFDLFAALPGLSLERLATHLERPGSEVETVWKAPRDRLR